VGAFDAFLNLAPQHGLLVRASCAVWLIRLLAPLVHFLCSFPSNSVTCVCRNWKGIVTENLTPIAGASTSRGKRSRLRMTFPRGGHVFVSSLPARRRSSARTFRPFRPNSATWKSWALPAAVTKLSTFTRAWSSGHLLHRHGVPSTYSRRDVDHLTQTRKLNIISPRSNRVRTPGARTAQVIQRGSALISPPSPNACRAAMR